MELATNTFSRGLQMDTHPITLGNDSLSDALNATFVTMNGNEVILQNDMGNRRVDHAYLPAGYQPVGMKEYGGVIYVAAYNPITNRSLIGSFPSPERKMGSECPDLGGELDLSKFSKEPENIFVDEENYKFLKSDTMLVRLTGDTSLHAGDKFSIYNTGYTSIPTEDLTNFNNIDSNGVKVETPKNKKYTLSLGILNSQNEFVDITKTLLRWNTDNTIENLEGKSDLYKFNYGYFIAPGKPTGVKYNDTTKNDRLLLEERQVIPVNTYSYKLVGPLYLKAELNHILNASYNIYGIKNSDTVNGDTVTLWVESVITYNCPDGISGNDSGDNNYHIFGIHLNESFKDGFVGFELKGLNVEIIQKEVEEGEEGEKVFTKYSNHSYNPKTNLYTITILKKYSCPNPNDNIINYYYCVPASDLENVYLRGLSEKGSINTSLLGSGEIDLIGWRFFNNKDDQTTLTYNLSAYPKYKSSFSDLKFTFTNVDDENDTITINADTIFNGKNTIQFNWKKLGFRERSLYKVLMTYREDNEDFLKETNKWFLTTQLFNNCYRPSHEHYMNDFSDPEKDNIRREYCTVKLELSVDRIIDNSPLKTIDVEGGKILIPSSEYNDNEGIRIIYTHNQEFDFDINTIVSIKNEELYPSYVTIFNDPKFDVNGYIDTESLESLLEFKNVFNNDTKDYFKNMITLSKELVTKYNDSTNIINTTGAIKYCDKYLSKGKSAGNLSIRNGFTTISDAIEKLIEQTDSFTGLFLDSEWHYGDDDTHYLWAMANSSEIFGHRAMNDSSDPPGDVTNIFYEEDGSPKFINLSLYYLKISQVFNKSDKKNVFIFLGIGKALGSGQTPEEAGGDDPYRASMSNYREGWTEKLNNKKEPYARIWWRTANLSYPWALLEVPWTPQPSERNRNTLINVIKDHFNNPDKIYICLYKNFSLSGFYIPNTSTENYNYEYNLSVPININIQQTSPGSVNDNSNAPIHFSTQSGNNINQELIISNVSLESSPIFQQIALNTSNIPLENVTVDSGINMDDKGDDLIANEVYIKDEVSKNLVKVENSLITPHSEEYGGQYYGFLYGNSTYCNIGSPSSGNDSYLYDIYGSDEEDGDGYEDYISLSYASINIVKKKSVNG